MSNARPKNGNASVRQLAEETYSHEIVSLTRKLCYRKDDRAMRPMYGCPEKFRESLTMPMATSQIF